jgi:hypothetical protein
MTIVAAGIVGGAVIGGAMSSSASSKASKSQSAAMDSASQAQLDAAHVSAGAMIKAAGASAEATIKGASISASAAKYAADIQWQMYEQARTDQLPWLQAGGRALGTLEGMVNAGPGEFTESPGYQFRLDQGNKNILANQSATGNLASGRTLKALQDYGQDYASFEYDKFLSQYYQSLSPYQSLAGVGLSSAQNIGGMGVQTGYGIGQTTMTGAGQQAGAYNSLAGIYGNLGNQLAANYMGQGNVIANNYMQQGNIAAQNSIAQGNIWGGVVNDIAMGIGKYSGGGGSSGSMSNYPMTSSVSNYQPAPYTFSSGYTYQPSPWG